MTTSHKQQHGTIMQLSPEGEVNSGEITKMIPETLSIIDSVSATHIKHSLKTQYLVDISGHSFYELSCTLYANEGKC